MYFPVCRELPKVSRPQLYENFRLRPRVDFKYKIPKTFIGFRVLQVLAEVTVTQVSRIRYFSLDDSKDDKRTTTKRITMEGH